MTNDDYIEKVRALLARPDAEHLKRIAVCLHASQCAYNHTDGCSWDYEIGFTYQAAGRPAGTWYGWRHAEYLIKAADKVMEKEVSPKALADLLELAKLMSE